MQIKNENKILYYFFLWTVLSFLSLKLKDIILERMNSLVNYYNPFFSFYEVHNKGAAFNLFTNYTNILILAAVVCIIILTALVLSKSSKLTNTMVSSIALLSCGMTLNTLERINNGYVTDYIYFSFAPTFPVFNIPDIFIVIGAFILGFSLMSRSKSK